jgi:hypothetical protein
LVLAAAFLASHVALLPDTLGDVDSINFALALHEFDVTRHQPHPPGHPVFVALGRITAAFTTSDAAALAFWGALLGAVSAFPLLWLFEAFAASEGGRLTGARGAAVPGRPRERALAAARLAVPVVLACPLFWFTAHRPMSDVPGLAVALMAQACFASSWARRRAVLPGGLDHGIDWQVVAGAFLAGLAAGLRVQTAWLTLPLLTLVTVQRLRQRAFREILPAGVALAAGALVWAVPLVVASGGFGAYQAALSAQTAEDLSGADLLIRTPTLRRLAFGLLQTFVQPWLVAGLGFAVFGLAVVGGVAAARRGSATVLLVGVAAVPYALFDLLFQETPYVRYALPLVPPLAYLAVRGAMVIGPGLAKTAAAGLAASSLAVTLPSSLAYARDGSPGFAAVERLQRDVRPPATIGLHHSLARTVQSQAMPGFTVLDAPPMREWMELSAYWRRGGRDPVWFLASPERMDLDLIDPLSWRTVDRFRWTTPRRLLTDGIKPAVVDLVSIDSPPGWFAEEGWHLTPEALNISERRGRSDAVAYVRRRQEPLWAFIGGRHARGDRPATVTIAIDGRTIDTWTVEPGARFFRRMPLPADSPDGPAEFARLVASYAPVSAPGEPAATEAAAPRVWFTEFGVHRSADLVIAQHRGWHEVEYGGAEERRWRWTSARAETFVYSAGMNLRLRVSGDSPMRYFDAAPDVVIRTGDLVLARARPIADFELDVPVPAGALARGGHTITIETSRTFVPAHRGESADRRRLGLRIFRVDVQANR